MTPDERLLKFSDLKPNTFKRYWRFFFWFNVLGTAAESFAALGFFVLLQRRVYTDPFTELEVRLISSWTIPLLVAFLSTFYYLAKRMVEGNVLPLLPKECFVDKAPWPVRDSPQRQLHDCKILQKRLSDYHVVAAAVIALLYALWGVLVQYYNEPKVDWTFTIWVISVGFGMAGLSYLRLQGFDPAPLVLAPQDNENRSILAIQQLISDRSRFHMRKNSMALRRFTIFLVQWLLSWIFRIWKTSLQNIPGRPSGEPNRRKEREIIDTEHLSVHQIQFIIRFIVLAALLSFAFRYHDGSGEVLYESGGAGAPWFHEWSLVTTYVSIAVIAALGTDSYRFVMRLIPRDNEESIHRLCAECFGIITESVSKAEQEAHLGRFDEKTGLARHWVFERDLLGGMLDRAKGSKKTFSMMLIDIDNFKMVNTLFNYIAADVLLSYVARSIMQFIRKESISRFGGEEFAAYLPGSDSGLACRRAEKIRSHTMRSIRVVRTSSGRLVAKYRADDGQELSHVIDHVPSHEALESLRLALSDTPRRLAADNDSPARRLLTKSPGTVWQLTVSVGVVSCRRRGEHKAASETSTPPPSSPTYRRLNLGHIREEYNRFVEQAGQCNAKAKASGRNQTFYAFEGDSKAHPTDAQV